MHNSLHSCATTLFKQCTKPTAPVPGAATASAGVDCVYLRLRLQISLSPPPAALQLSAWSHCVRHATRWVWGGWRGGCIALSLKGRECSCVSPDIACRNVYCHVLAHHRIPWHTHTGICASGHVDTSPTSMLQAPPLCISCLRAQRLTP
jgi:hypothetical protein